MLYQAFPPDLQIRAGQGLGDFAKSEPGASLSRQWKQAKRLKPTEARFLFESPLRKEVVFEHDLLITALKNPYERIEFLLEIALEHLPKGPLRERYLNHLPQTLEMLESPAHALEYLQMLINLLLPENSDPWFDLTLKKLREMEESDFRASKARPLLNLAIEYSRFSKAKKLLNFLETPEDQAKESQRINEEKAKALLKQGQKARIERELKSILKGLSTKANQPESLQIFLDLEEKAAKTGSNRLRKAILSQLFLAWQDFKPKASLPESFTLDFIERLLDIKLFRYAKECSKNLSKPARIEARILALAQRPRSQRPSFIHELLRTFQDLKPSEEKARFLTRTWQLTPSKTFLWMRKQFLKQAKACIEAMSPQDLKETGVNLIKTASEKGAYFEVNEMIGIKGKELENYRNYRIRRKERDNSFSFR